MKTTIYLLIMLGLTFAMFNIIPKAYVIETYSIKVIPYNSFLGARHYKMTLEEFKKRAKKI